ncbi:uncharacterized protein LOC111881221 [Lactuca sativa]|uniref:Uncharacterized protein n=1 Tax=Lactuca sativa TaxID=4236 RepID=A0A9R1UI39_LACSA|nr:uncharacterized protein LOC111881221 [Lactuca sativa]KAJ0187443.1 hypothetical protein LSAT_V11C900459510 [Lactuca sativa]
MGCFLGCFGSSKDRKRRKQRYKVIPRDQYPRIQNLVQPDVSLVQSIKDKPSNSLSEASGKNEESLSISTRKKVTFDTNVTTYEHVQVYDSTESLLERNEKGETFPKSAETHSDSGSQDGSDIVNAVSYPPNYRYGNCLESDDEVEDSDEDDEDDEEEDEIICQEVWCESIPVPSAESRAESSSLDKVGSNSNARDRSAYVIPVLNPVENLSQWKALKMKETPPPTKALNFHRQKENSSLNSAPPAVDSSLSNWLVNTPNNKGIGSYNSGIEAISSGKNSSIEDRPILGALTVEELKQFSASSCTPTPKKSPSRSPDDMPIIGSVGSYWSSTPSYKGIPNSNSKYREDKKVNWHNTPFETRLERALNGGVAEA